MSGTPTPGPSGLLVVDKPGGMTSHDVVTRVRRLARTRKVGHAGTLDPMATGLLVLGLGRATRLLGHLALADKTYAATVRLGVATTTDDAEGEPVSRSTTAGLDAPAVRAAVAGFVGEIDQVPSAVSAVRVDGRRAHERVRAGEQVDLAARRVRISGIDVPEIRLGDAAELDLVVRCSSGTYIRALARDLGAVLGVGGHLRALRRTTLGPVTLAEATTLSQLEAADAAVSSPPSTLPLLSMGEAARCFFDTVSVAADQARAVSHGRPLSLEPPAPGGVRLFAVLDPSGDLLALYEPVGGGLAKPGAVLV